MKRLKWIWLALFVGCAGTYRDCASCGATEFGANWIVLQYGYDGRPINCWKLENTAVSNEANTDGIYWQDSKTRHLVHISGWYNRVQVVDGGKFETAALLLGVEVDRCIGGAYVPSPADGGGP